ncbi:MAG TPA: response regulator [Pyrinomonadaceae bacterium]|jgi:CheY-like chemotaxis protein
MTETDTVFAPTVDARREIERLKSSFTETLVRDVRVPLTSVLGLLELFESKLQAREPFDLEDRQLLSSAIEHGERIRRLLDDHLEIAQQHDRPLSLNRQDTPAEQLIAEAAEALRGEAALRGVALNINTNPRSCLLYVDARQMRRALTHILSAALAATPDGGTLKIETQSITGTRMGDDGRRFTVISITDSGSGIPAEQVPFIFDAFWQATNASLAAKGRGLGLAIAKRIVAAHSGNVSVRSKLGLGTVYSITLLSAPPAETFQAQRLLIVEDVPDLLLLLRKLVERMGFEVETASGAHEALEIIREKRIDLLLTDWSMPGMNGGELISALKRDERLRAIPTVVLTGHDTDTERREAKAAGCDRFLVKPIKRDELQSVILELLPLAVSNH